MNENRRVITGAISLRGRIRAETRAEHERLEGLLGIPESKEQHVERLKKFYGFYAGWEPGVMGRLSDLKPSMESRRKLPLLEGDLRYFGVGNEELDALNVCRDLPGVVDRATALGSMYVMEGSTLGGQVISRRLESGMGLRDGAGYSYYRSYGVGVGEMWTEFLGVMETQTEAGEHGRVVEAARETFTSLYWWFS